MIGEAVPVIGEVVPEKAMPTDVRYATVTAPSGSTVNLRVRANAGAALVERVPVGSRIEVLREEGDWMKVKVDGKTGYMMKAFLVNDTREEETESVGTLEERVAWLEERVAKLENI